MPISPTYRTDVHGALSFTWTDDSGAAVNLTGATLSVTLNSTLPNEPAFAGTGTFTLTNPAAGQFTYQPSSADVGLARVYEMQFEATFADASTLHARPLIWRVNRLVADVITSEV